jgi:hypothetical protein
MTTNSLIDNAIARRKYWVDEIELVSGKFGDNADRIEQEISKEIAKENIHVVVDHLRLCGVIPEKYLHDSSAEKLYSKYTDVLLTLAFRSLGMKSNIFTERADAADVEGFGKNFSLVADAKAMRLSRTAKNQKDFKVEAMDKWKYGREFAIVVAPLYQLPSKASQIYSQATTRNVCILSYSHLSVLVNFASQKSEKAAENCLKDILIAVSEMNPTKDAQEYWRVLNRTILSADKTLASMWRDEKIAAQLGLAYSKTEALTFLTSERERISRLSHQEAIKQLLVANNIENRAKVITGVQDNGLINLE